jgi:hypothetical protein
LSRFSRCVTHAGRAPQLLGRRGLRADLSDQHRDLLGLFQRVEIGAVQVLGDGGTDEPLPGCGEVVGDGPR